MKKSLVFLLSLILLITITVKSKASTINVTETFTLIRAEDEDVDPPEEAPDDIELDTIRYIATNNTGIDWVDFHFRLLYSTILHELVDVSDIQFQDPVSGGAFTLTGGGNGKNFIDFIVTGTPLANGATNIFQFNVFSRDSHSYTIEGRPTVIPEPGTLLLFATGLLWLTGFARQRKK